MVDEAREDVSPLFAELYAKTGRRSIPPERLLRALRLQILFSVRSERQLLEGAIAIIERLLSLIFCVPDDPIGSPEPTHEPDQGAMYEYAC